MSGWRMASNESPGVDYLPPHFSHSSSIIPPHLIHHPTILRPAPPPLHEDVKLHSPLYASLSYQGHPSTAKTITPLPLHSHYPHAENTSVRAISRRIPRGGPYAQGDVRGYLHDDGGSDWRVSVCSDPSLIRPEWQVRAHCRNPPPHTKPNPPPTHTPLPLTTHNTTPNKHNHTQPPPYSNHPHPPNTPPKHPNNPTPYINISQPLPPNIYSLLSPTLYIPLHKSTST